MLLRLQINSIVLPKFIKIGSNQLDKVIIFFVLNMAYSWNNRIDFVVRYMYGKQMIT